jgi:hypothetical protein
VRSQRLAGLIEWLDDEVATFAPMSRQAGYLLLSVVSAQFYYTSWRRGFSPDLAHLPDYARDRDGHLVSHAFSPETCNPTFCLMQMASEVV